MKKLFSGALLLATILSLFSCKSSNEVKTSSQEPQEKEQRDSWPSYPILAYNHLDNIHVPLNEMAESGINMVGFIRPLGLSRLKNTGLKAIVIPKEAPPGRHVKIGKSTGIQTIEVDDNSSWLSLHSFWWGDLSDDEIDTIIKNLVGNTADNDLVAGYFLADEPSSLEFPALGKAVEAIKKYAPGKLAYINLYPNYASVQEEGESRDKSQLGTKTYKEYLERFVEEVQPQFISYDNYDVQYSVDMKNKKKASEYYDNLLIVRQVALEHGLPYWCIMASCQLRPKYTAPSAANMRFQAYTALAAGYDGISWYQYGPNGYHHNPIDRAGKKTLVWDYLKEANQAILTLGPIIKTLTSTGVYFSSNASQDIAPVLPGEVVQSVQSKEPIMVGEFRNKNGIRYAMIVNLSLAQSTKFTFSTKKSVRAVWKVFLNTDDTVEAQEEPVGKVKDGEDQISGASWGDITLFPGSGILVRMEE